MKNILVSCLLFFSFSAIAKPEEIDVLGLVPGKSTLEDIIKISAGGIEGGLYYLVVGGYKLPCMPQFIQNKLSILVCPTGIKYSSASNFEIHDQLKKGFTQKFGASTYTYVDPVLSRLGVEYKAEETWWVDDAGNALTLYSIQGQIDRGALSLMSAEVFNKMKEDIKAKDRLRKF